MYTRRRKQYKIVLRQSGFSSFCFVLFRFISLYAKYGRIPRTNTLRIQIRTHSIHDYYYYYYKKRKRKRKSGGWRGFVVYIHTYVYSFATSNEFIYSSLENHIYDVQEIGRYVSGVV